MCCRRNCGSGETVSLTQMDHLSHGPDYADVKPCPLNSPKENGCCVSADMM